MKLKLILSMLLPLMNLAVTSLREKDENSTGADDVAANQIEAAVKSLQDYTNS
jgi:hypothetical protein